jgi:UDP-N-acetylmuramate dehydrogenase
MKRTLPIRLGGELRGEVHTDESLALHTSLRVGGAAAIYAIPEDLDDLRTLLLIVAAENVPYLMLGGGNNLLVMDGGFPGVVISLRKFRELERRQDGLIVAGAGVTNGALVRYSEEQQLTGLEFLIGIPGTVGGALGMNAGAHGEEILDRVETLTTMLDGEIKVTAKADLVHSYRTLELSAGEIIVSAVFKLDEGTPALIEERIERFRAHRRNAQRVSHPNAGSFFRNPPGEQAWRLIDRAGLRGERIGGAGVSEQHANFLVNLGGATARDFIVLAALIKEKVKAVTGIELHEEVRIVGEN